MSFEKKLDIFLMKSNDRVFEIITNIIDFFFLKMYRAYIKCLIRFDCYNVLARQISKSTNKDKNNLSYLQDLRNAILETF